METKNWPSRVLSLVLLGLSALWINSCELSAEGDLFADDITRQGISGAFLPTNYAEWQGVLGIVATDFGVCTVSLIDPEIVLTAAACVPSSFNNVEIYGGANMDEPRSAIEKAEISDAGKEWDIALLKLTTPLTATECYRLSSATPSVGEMGWLVGYGATASSTYNIGTHRKGATTILNTDSEGIETGGATGLCVGDEGGPLFTEEGGAWVVSGIASAYREDCSPENGSRFADASDYRSWIDQKLRELTGHGLDDSPCRGGDYDAGPDGSVDADTDTDADSDSDGYGDDDDADSLDADNAAGCSCHAVGQQRDSVPRFSLLRLGILL